MSFRNAFIKLAVYFVLVFVKAFITAPATY